MAPRFSECAHAESVIRAIEEDSMSKLVADAMTASPRTISRRATVVEAASTMLEGDVGSLPVVDDRGFLAG